MKKWIFFFNRVTTSNGLGLLKNFPCGFFFSGHGLPISHSLGCEAKSLSRQPMTSERILPEFREIFPDRLLRPGAKSSLRCLVTGNPLPQVSWRLYSRPVVEGLGVRIGDFVDSQGLLMSFINISAVTPEHGGIYSCHARNEIGAISHSARLSVFGPPYIHPMDNITVVTGDEVNVDCAVSGHPLRSIRWRKGIAVLFNGFHIDSYYDKYISV
ncbi:hypothetical protein TNIN_258151 [Trichonephila inaurata madagascariensis]|uniref:Ig-like domain-containing protein n=1 Tax=Trichonephila inaurata madagascariensis TaxID=2747483 RepID=A0A8X6XBW8_9ARAC|nr:hypothetical protein TNIN_258151 [Trichonephila inaurata madagascariensis]